MDVKDEEITEENWTICPICDSLMRSKELCDVCETSKAQGKKLHKYRLSSNGDVVDLGEVE